MRIDFTNAVVEDDGYGVEVNGRSLEAIISTALGTRLGDKGGYSSGLPRFKANSCDVTVIITPHPTECTINTMVGFRFDTLNKHFSNMGLLNGSGTLGKKPDTDGAKYLQEDYEKYITQLQQKSGFIVVTPDDFEGRKPNVDEIKSLAIKHGADMIVIDQLSLMSDKRRADIPRIAYNNISEDLFLMSKELKKPVLLMAQANQIGRASCRERV